MNKQIKIILFSVILIASGNSLLGVMAYPYPVEINQPDGTKITIILKGDEHVKWAETPDGYSILRNSNGIYEYAIHDSLLNMVPSGIKVRDESERSTYDIQFLSRTDKGLFYSKSQAALMKSISGIYETAPEKAFPATGSRNLLCILIGFTDKAFTKTQAEFTNLFNQTGYAVNGARGSVKDYYLENSYNQLNLTISVAGPYTASNTLAYYGDNDANDDDVRPRELVSEAVNLADRDVNYANFDNDNNGSVDGVYVIYAGYGEEAGGGVNCIWAHSWSLVTTLTLDGKTVSRYSSSSELSGNAGSNVTNIGVICHEFGHVLGSPDFYDTDYATGGQYKGTGYWDLMGGGSWNNSGKTPAHHNAYTKTVVFGWASSTILSSGTQITLNNAAENSNSFFRFNTATTNEYFLIENRQQLKFDGSIPGHGMIIYHVDGNYISIAGSRINAGTHQGMYPVCAGATGNPPTTYGTINGGGCPFPGTGGKTYFTDSTTPNSLSWALSVTGKSIEGISENSTGKTISFSFMGGVPCAAPTVQVSSFAPSALTDNSMTINWTRGNGNAVLVLARQGTAVTENPLNATSYTANAAFGGGMQIGAGNWVVYNGTGTSVILTALSLGTTYHYAIYEYSSAGYCYRTLALTGSANTTGCNIPTAPIVGAVTQPTCTSATGSVIINGLPVTGVWTLTRTPGGTTTSGTGIHTTITGLSSGTYSYKVANVGGCISVSSAVLVIKTQPVVPGQPGSITGSSSVCIGSSHTYSVSLVSGATSYSWNLPSGWSGSSQTNSILTTSGVTGGTISVSANNACGASTQRTLFIVMTSLPTVTTSVISDASLSTATGGGNVTSDGGSAITSRGVCWSTNLNPTISNSTTSDGAFAGSFISAITGLTNGVTYHIRAYATNCAGTAYGADIPYTHNPTGTYDIVTDEMKVYPNPVSGILNIEFKNDNYKTINILNSQGGLLRRENDVTPRQQIDFTRFKPGFYILEFIKSSGETRRVKVIKNK